MSIEEIKKRNESVHPLKRLDFDNPLDLALTWTRHYWKDTHFLLEQNQRLVEALEEIARRENPYSMISISEDALQAYKLLEKKD